MFSTPFKIIVIILIICAGGYISYQYPKIKTETTYTKLVSAAQEYGDDKLYAMSASALSAALDIKPDQYQLYPALASSYIHWGIETKNAEGSVKMYDEAVRLMDVYITKFPNLSEVWVHRGMAQYQLGNYAKAAANFTEAIRLNPRDVAADKLLKLSEKKLRTRF